MATPIFDTPQTNPFGLIDVGRLANPTFVDIDGDGDLDAFVGNFDGNTLYFENTGNANSPSFGASQTNPFNLIDVGLLASPTFVDIDGDGDLDAFVGNYDGNTLYFENTGSASSPSFGASQTNPFGLIDVGNSAAPTLVDIDGDGDLDAFVGNNLGNTLYFENTGNANSPSFGASQPNPFNLSDVGLFATPTFVDIDGDGDLDAFVGNSVGDTLYFENLECFVTGTRILTDKGEVAVENLAIGDNVVTAEGKLEPIKWIGYQTIAPHRVKNPLRGYPILIKASALGNNLPQRDLSVSPDHAMFFEGVLINAGALVNGTSIVKTEPKEAFTYYHVELDNHTLLLAEGASAESYMPQNEDRLAYENGAEYEDLYPHGSNLMLWPMDYPRISSWNKVPRYMRKKLDAIAQELGFILQAAA